MKIGVAEESLRQPREVLLECARALGFEGVELSGAGDDYERLLEAQRQTGVPVVSVACDEPDFGRSDVARRAAGRESAVRCVEAAARAGAGIVRLPIHTLVSLDDFPLIARLQEDLPYVARRGEELGVLIGCQVPLPAAETLRFLDTIDSDFVLCYYDVARAVHEERDPAKEIRLLRGRMCQVGLREEGGRFFGEGRVDLLRCLEALVSIDFPAYLILAPPFTPEPLEALRRDLRDVKAALADARAMALEKVG